MIATATAMDVVFLTQTYPRTPEDTAGPFIRELARALVRGGDGVTVLAPHAAASTQPSSSKPPLASAT